ncbi:MULTISPECIES: hypothetical protein [Macrococcoides]|uniref:hypothetical protein n=1 Tax=Macrococcoides TaxID=3076173 RepID=UPI0002FB7201|nr:hypothetical protein [Macrococcus]MDJ1108580.1 hypothetical protein [Macrococcus caseolyticus]PKE13224.1 hypothetical protein CW685_00415 [Macrococcus caseolyticus]TDM23789.1 hypothetical protein ETI02_05155 [Macrococcus canis]
MRKGTVLVARAFKPTEIEAEERKPVRMKKAEINGELKGYAAQQFEMHYGSWRNKHDNRNKSK